MRWIVGGLLLGAAILKAVQLFVEPTLAIAGPVEQAFALFQLTAEIALGLFAISGLYWHRIRAIAILVFSGFAVYSFSLAIGGATSCGCFGPVKVHPWWTFALDLAVVFGLGLSKRRGSFESELGADSQPVWRRAVPTAFLGLTIVATALFVRLADRRTAVADGMTSVAGGLVIVEPERWIGKPLPIADSIDLDLSDGDWVELLHRHDCPECQRAVPQYEALAEHADGRHVAIVEVPPYGDSAMRSDGKYARLTNDREWFVQTPVEIQLADGVVTRASTELPAIRTP